VTVAASLENTASHGCNGATVDERVGAGDEGRVGIQKECGGRDLVVADGTNEVIHSQVLPRAELDVVHSLLKGLYLLEDGPMQCKANAEERLTRLIVPIRHFQLPNCNLVAFGTRKCRFDRVAPQQRGPLLIEGPHVLEVSLGEASQAGKFPLQPLANRGEGARPPEPLARVRRDIPANRVVEAELLRVGCLHGPILATKNCFLYGLRRVVIALGITHGKTSSKDMRLE
jgi:hypothetical protein